MNKVGILALGILLLLSCEEESDNCCNLPEVPLAEALTDADRVGLIWSDEFDKTTLDLNKWSFDLTNTSPSGLTGWGNGEEQYYTDRPENIFIENGFLKIKAKKESFSGSAYTSARIKTQGKFSFTHGKMVVRAMLPQSAGTWPAVWLLGDSFIKAGWPQCGEIDLVEQGGQAKNSLYAATHWFDKTTNANAAYRKEFLSGPTGVQPRKFTLEWTPTFIRMFIDGTKFYEMAIKDDMPFRDPFFILANVAMGGTLGGTIGPSFSSDEMWIDYIRVYE